MTTKEGAVDRAEGPPPGMIHGPSSAELIRATMFAAGAAAIVLLMAVLPAEYGTDPTGLGKRLGLLRTGSQGEAAVPPAADATTAPTGATMTRQPEPFKSEELSITLGWREGAEIKAHMKQGQRMVFSWQSSGGAVEMDMHGERFKAPEGQFTSYWKEDQISSGHGAFEAPFDGTHGWFWQNYGKDAVTITVKASGYFEKIGRP